MDRRILGIYVDPMGLLKPPRFCLEEGEEEEEEGSETYSEAAPEAGVVGPEAGEAGSVRLESTTVGTTTSTAAFLRIFSRTIESGSGRGTSTVRIRRR